MKKPEIQKKNKVSTKVKHMFKSNHSAYIYLQFVINVLLKIQGKLSVVYTICI
jgi:hypothetical protein